MSAAVHQCVIAGGLTLRTPRRLGVAGDSESESPGSACRKAACRAWQCAAAAAPASGADDSDTVTESGLLATRTPTSHG